MAETSFASMLLLSGVVIIAINLALVADLYRPVWMFSMRLLLGLAMIVVGLLRIFVTLWKVGASEERKSAIVKSAGEIELLNCLLYTSPSPRDRTRSRMPSSA